MKVSLTFLVDVVFTVVWFMLCVNSAVNYVGQTTSVVLITWATPCTVALVMGLSIFAGFICDHEWAKQKERP